MENTFLLTIRSPEEEEFLGEAKSISFYGQGGDLEVFAEHASITTTILFSPVKVITAEETEEYFLVRRGVFQFDNETNEGSLQALYCERKGEVSLKTAHEYLQFVEEKLRTGKDLSAFEIQYLKGEQFAIMEQIEHTKGI